jgi:Bacterial PH domain
MGNCQYAGWTPATIAFMTDSATVTFRLPLTALIGVFGFIVGMTPVAFGAPGLQVLYLLPLSLTIWLVRTRTVAGPDTMVAYRVWSSRQITWSDLAGLRIDDRSRVWAVLHGGDEVRLPSVRARHLPVLAAISGGRLPDFLAKANEKQQ